MKRLAAVFPVQRNLSGTGQTRRGDSTAAVVTRRRDERRRPTMKGLISTAALILLSFGGARLPASQQPATADAAPCVTTIAECSETMTFAGAKLRYYRTFALDQPNARIERAVLIIHGGQRTPERYFKALVDAATAAGRIGDTLIVAPGFKIGEDKPAPGDLWWDEDDGWKKGDPSTKTRPERISSFEVADRVVAVMADRTRFP